MSAEEEDRTRRDRARGGDSFEGWIKWNGSYVRDEWQGRIKVAEILCSFLAGVILPYSVYYYPSRFSFFSFVTWTSFINAVIDLILHLTSLWERLIYICRAPEVYMVLDAIATFAFLLGSSLIAHAANLSGHTGNSGASAFFGFLCMILFGIEGFIHFQRWRQGRSDRQNPPSEEGEKMAGAI